MFCQVVQTFYTKHHIQAEKDDIHSFNGKMQILVLLKFNLKPSKCTFSRAKNFIVNKQ